MTEKWLPIKGYEDRYRVSTLGRVFSVKKNKYLTPVIGKSGYAKVFLSVVGCVKTFKVHRLVADTFLDGHGNLIHHIDENTLNNSIDNLCYVSPSEHFQFHPKMQNALLENRTKHPIPRGTRLSIRTEFKPGNQFRFPSGHKNPRAKFKNEEVMLIKELKQSGVKRGVIAEMFNVVPKRIDCILYGYAWRSI